MKKAAQQEMKASNLNGADFERPELSKWRGYFAAAAFSAAVLLPAQAAKADEMPTSEITTDNTDVNKVFDIEFSQDMQVDEPVVRTLHKGQGPVDLAKSILDKEELKDKELILDITADMLERAGYNRPKTLSDLNNEEYKKIPAGTQFEIPISKVNQRVYVIQDGDTFSRLYVELGWKAAGATAEEFRRFNAIPDKDNIISGEEMFYAPAGAAEAQAGASNPQDQPKQPESKPDSPPVVPPPNTNPKVGTPDHPAKPDKNMDGPPLNPILVAGNEIKTGTETAGQLDISQAQVEFDNSLQVSQEEAEQTVDLLVEATRSLENPLYDIPTNLGEKQLPSPVADQLEDDREYWVDELTSGNVNPAYIQNRTIRQLADKNETNDENARIDIAANYVKFVADRNQWIIPEDEVQVLAEMMTKGTDIYDFEGRNVAYIEQISQETYDDVSLTVDLLNVSMESHLTEQTQLVEKANEQLETLAPELADLDQTQMQSIAKVMISARQNKQTTNDYLYETLVAKLDGKSMEEGLAMISEGILASNQAQDLAKMFPSFKSSLDQTAQDFISAEGPKELTSFNQNISELLDNKVAEITQYGQQLGEIQVEIDALGPQLGDLDENMLYEVASLILSHKEQDTSDGQDDWYYLTDAKAFLAEQDMQTAIDSMVENIYSAEDAQLLWKTSVEERQNVDLQVQAFLAGQDKNLKVFLDSMFNELETRITQAQADASLVIQAVKTAVPELDVQDLDIMTLAMDELLGRDTHELASTILSDYEKSTGITTSEEVLTIIDFEIVKLQVQDRQSGLRQIGEDIYDFFNQKNAVYYLANENENGEADKNADPAIRKLAQMVMSGNYTIDYADGTVGIFTDEFADKLKMYDTVPGFIFPGTSWQVMGYGGEDLTPLFDYLGLDKEAILDSPFNDHLALKDGQITSDKTASIWFDASLWQGGSEPDFEKAVDWVYGEIPGLKYTIKSGDTLSEIGAMFRDKDGNQLDWHKIVDWNRGRVNEDLAVGEVITIPNGFSYYSPPQIPKSSVEVQPSTAENLFKKTGKDIKSELTSQYKESGHLNAEQLDRLGSVWPGESLQPDAAEAFRMMSSAFEKKYGKPLELVDSYRSYDEQIATKKWWTEEGDPDMAATPGKSNHGWGLAIDFGDQDSKTDKVGLKFSQEEYAWLMKNAPDFGWVNPDWAHDGKGVEEAWHFEYVNRPKADTTKGSQETPAAKPSNIVTKDVINNIDHELHGVSPDVIREFAQNTLDIAHKQGIQLTLSGLAGYMAHISSESDFTPSAIGDNGKSEGIFQAQGQRNDGLPADLAGQIAFSFVDMAKDGKSMGYDMLGLMQDPNASLNDVVQSGFKWLRPQAYLDNNDAGMQHRYDRAETLLDDMSH